MSDTGNKIKEKYEQLGENPETYHEGLLHAKPINYWDYVGVDTLLSLQKPRTDFKDETIFIMYHQVTELLLKMMRHELEQIVDEEKITEAFLLTKLGRVNRYTTMLITSFDIMKDGMDYDDFNQFRKALTPASGFQSAQFRYIEILCTSLGNLVNDEGKKRLPAEASVEDYFEQIYWKDAGLNRKTGKKTLMMEQFEEKYLESLMAWAQKVQGRTVEDRVLEVQNPSVALTEKLRDFDRLYNIEWPLVHLRTAEHYLNSKGENKAATGGSEWKKYLHPKYQQRKFFPLLWTESEKKHWGETADLN
ncbi:tryptophan 2,3-dioxygenase family protein [Zobellia galactanivorans]|uniref:tryptophan 2,3-dioxygenase family protein n=1 Tax=Zobellia galactanivorans (strain DSM 12802 / CCUG 47099 / CIP 106680 / NCIMB 13871 / Dsij) TaxID=63186 RepID=UPI001C069EA0|nr:tryptophan 2,3-dioxygenase family protein [Zobellia galactanivorans]MBU3025581.1 tryptophan 2,3-dioxygenase [Zobellia galactanivorans]